MIDTDTLAEDWARYFELLQTNAFNNIKTSEFVALYRGVTVGQSMDDESLRIQKAQELGIDPEQLVIACPNPSEGLLDE